MKNSEVMEYDQDELISILQDNSDHNEADSDIEGSPKSQGMYSSDEAEFSTTRII
ncbi:7728_t:CDS:2 [Funneliformis mosseae]|uniref:7728_t:CDS:1 n=1 Tax=Funneliformis mosseae TaxID=27381 RepID=A0A9N9CF74_FUNMO|nr:7728_t:CDS:2 [Funneliformis mosseae]